MFGCNALTMLGDHGDLTSGTKTYKTHLVKLIAYFFL